MKPAVMMKEAEVRGTRHLLQHLFAYLKAFESGRSWQMATRGLSSVRACAPPLFQWSLLHSERLRGYFRLLEMVRSLRAMNCSSVWAWAVKLFFTLFLSASLAADLGGNGCCGGCGDLKNCSAPTVAWSRWGPGEQ